MKRGLNAVCYEQEMYIYFEREAPLMEADYYEITLSDGQCIQTKKTNVSFYELNEKTSYEVELFLCLDGRKELLDKAVFTTTAFRPRLDVTKAPYFAIGDGKTMNTKALQKALDEADGRVVYFPNGRYLTGALTLHSQTELYLEEDTVIMGSNDPKDYLPLVPSRSDGVHMLCYQALINVGDIDKDGACNARDITIRGGSIIGGGIILMERMEESAIEFTKDYIDSLSEEELATFGRGVATINGRLRGRLIEMRNTENIVISNVNLGKGPYWNVHFIYCDNVVVHGCDINTRGIHNGDGLNPDSSTNVTVFDCTFDTGDNCIAIKSGKNPEGNMVNRPTKHVRIFDVKGSGGGIAIGSELSGGCEDVVAWNLDLSMSSLGFGIKTTKKRGGLIKDIHVLVALYAILWIVILGLRSTGESFSQYMYAGDWDNYVENVRCLMSNASFLGTSETLRGMEHIHEFLLERNNYLFTILYYGGWSFVFLFLLYATLFLIVLAKMLGFSNRNIHKNHLIFTASFWVLAVRTVLGVLYTFAIMPYPVSLPFAGKAGIITDSLAFALLLICSYENRKIVEMLNYKVVPIANVFPGDNEFEVLDEETREKYDEEFWMDTVIVKSGDEEIICLTEWITHDDHDFVVFDYGEGVFILEHSQEGAWHTVEDEKITNEVFAKYLRCIKPVYMEVDYEED